MLNKNRLGKSLHVLVIASIMLLLPACLTTTSTPTDPKPTPPVVEITGLNVTQVEYINEAGDVLGAFYENTNGTWSEDIGSSKDFYVYNVVSKESSSVHLYDPSEDYSLELNIATKEVIFSGEVIGTIGTVSMDAPTRNTALKLKATAVTQIIFGDAEGNTLGDFQQNTDGTWTERGYETNTIFNFAEVNRDAWSVYLYDGSRDLSLQLDLFDRAVIYLDSYLYSILDASDTIVPLVKGTNVNKVVFGDGSGALGEIKQNADGTWTERGYATNDTFQFTEENRDEWSVYLYDSSRDLSLQLDLNLEEVIYLDSTLYFILDVEAPAVNIGVSAANVNKIEFGDTVGNALGEIKQNADGTWTERGYETNAIFNFTEERRDDWSVYLYDSSRDLSLRLNLFLEEVIYLGEYLYTILNAEASTANSDVSGVNVTRVEFADANGTLLGNFHENTDGTWTEDGLTEKNRFLFYRVDKTSDAVFLYDPTRDMYLQLNLATNSVNTSQDETFTELSKLYYILDITDGAPETRVF